MISADDDALSDILGELKQHIPRLTEERMRAAFSLASSPYRSPAEYEYATMSTGFVRHVQ